jgi:hypothetical protein
MSDYYGDNTRWFIATVVNSNPPLGYEGRVKIRIHGLHSIDTIDIPEDHLPWAQCVIPVTEGGVSGIGKIVPRVLPDALVFGFFMDGKDSQIPLIFGSLPKSIEMQSQVQEENEQKFTSNNISLTDIALVEDSNSLNDAPGKLSRLDYPNIIKHRKLLTVQFFQNQGYDYKPSIAIAESLSRKGFISGFRGSNPKTGGFGLVSWKNKRFTELKKFSSKYKLFTTQLEYIAHELNTNKKSVQQNIKSSESLFGKKGSIYIFAKDYMKLSEEELDNLLNEESGRGS